MKKLNNLIIFVTVLLFYNCTSGGDPDPSAFRFDHSFRNGTNDVIIVRRYLNPIDNEISSNLPFVNQQFNESMEKTVGEAKASIEQYFNSKIQQLGIDAVKANPDLLLPKIIQSENNNTDETHY